MVIELTPMSHPAEVNASPLNTRRRLRLSIFPAPDFLAESQPFADFVIETQRQKHDLEAVVEVVNGDPPKRQDPDSAAEPEKARTLGDARLQVLGVYVHVLAKVQRRQHDQLDDPRILTKAPSKPRGHNENQAVEEQMRLLVVARKSAQPLPPECYENVLDEMEELRNQNRCEEPNRRTHLSPESEAQRDADQDGSVR